MHIYLGISLIELNGAYFWAGQYRIALELVVSLQKAQHFQGVSPCHVHRWLCFSLATRNGSNISR